MGFYPKSLIMENNGIFIAKPKQTVISCFTVVS